MLLRDEPRYLRELEEYYFNDTNYKQVPDGTGGVNKRPDPAPALVPFLSQRGAAAVRRILVMMEPEIEDADFASLTPDELKLYFTLTARAEAPQVAPSIEATRLVFNPN